MTTIKKTIEFTIIAALCVIPLMILSIGIAFEAVFNWCDTRTDKQKWIDGVSLF